MYPGKSSIGYPGLRVDVKIWTHRDATARIEKYQTRVDSDDDWELVVLNLLRRPSGIAENYGVQRRSEGGSESRHGERGLFIYMPQKLDPSCRGTSHSASICRQALDVGGN